MLLEAFWGGAFWALLEGIVPLIKYWRSTISQTRVLGQSEVELWSLRSTTPQTRDLGQGEVVNYDLEDLDLFIKKNIINKAKKGFFLWNKSEKGFNTF
jgi:hypothetical protein